jgi:hypothetical protein
VVGTVAPVVEAAVQPVLGTVTDAVGTLSWDGRHDRAGQARRCSRCRR